MNSFDTKMCTARSQITLLVRSFKFDNYKNGISRWWRNTQGVKIDKSKEGIVANNMTIHRGQVKKIRV